MSYKGNVTAVLSHGLGGFLGKKGTASDITLYNFKQGDTILSFVEATTYPDKIQPLVSSLNMCNQVLLKVDSVNPEFAEKIVALDMAGVTNGYLIVKDDILDAIRSFTKDTIAERYDVVDEQAVFLRERLAAQIPNPSGDCVVQIDHSFMVKGVGTVALGVVKEGIIRRYDTLKISPSRGEAYVKSVQVHDVDMQEAPAGVRVGLALKDVKPEDVSRGTLLTAEEIPPVTEFELECNLSKYSPKNIGVGDQITVNLHLNYAPAKIVDGNIEKNHKNKLRIVLEKPVPNYPGRMLFMDPGSKMPRVFGFATIK